MAKPGFGAAFRLILGGPDSDLDSHRDECGSDTSLITLVQSLQTYLRVLEFPDAQPARQNDLHDHRVLRRRILQREKSTWELSGF